jgi:hypothetical protein
VNYLPRLVSNRDPLSQIARITGVRHCTRHLDHF